MKYGDTRMWLFRALKKDYFDIILVTFLFLKKDNFRPKIRLKRLFQDYINNNSVYQKNKKIATYHVYVRLC